VKKITQTIKDLEGKSYQQVLELLDINKIKCDGMLISVNTQTAYLWKDSKLINSKSIRA